MLFEGLLLNSTLLSSAFCSHQEAVCLSADHTSAAPTGKPCQSGTPHPLACIFPLWTSRLTYQETRRCLSGKVQSRVGFSYQGYLSYKNFKMHESTSHTARTGKNVIVKTCERVGGTKPTILHKEVKGRKRMELIFLCFLLWNVTLHTCHFLRSSPISGKSLKRIPLAEAQIVVLQWNGADGAGLPRPNSHQVAPLPSRPAKDTCNCQICLPSSHLHCTLHQEFSVLVIQ